MHYGMHARLPLPLQSSTSVPCREIPRHGGSKADLGDDAAKAAEREHVEAQVRQAGVAEVGGDEGDEHRPRRRQLLREVRQHEALHAQA